MSRIITEAEQSSFYSLRPSDLGDRMRVSEAIARNACDIAEEIGARVIVAFTESGQTARFASQARPTVPIIGLSPNANTLRRLALFWGVIPWHVEPLRDSDEMIDRAHALLLSRGLVSPGDRFVTIFGAPVGVSGTTNAIHVQVVE